VINGLGFVIIFACVFGSFIVAGGKMDVILHALPHELTAIGGASLGAFLVANTVPTAKLAGKGVVRAFKGTKWKSDTYRELLSLLFALLTTFKKGGATGIEPHLDAPEESSIFSRHPKVLADHHLVEFTCDYPAARPIFTDRAVGPADRAPEADAGADVVKRPDRSGRADWAHRAVRQQRRGLDGCGAGKVELDPAAGGDVGRGGGAGQQRQAGCDTGGDGRRDRRRAQLGWAAGRWQPGAGGGLLAQADGEGRERRGGGGGRH
jgi:hypothetical protein